VSLRTDVTVEQLNRRSDGRLPGWFGVEVTDLCEGSLTMQYAIRPEFLAPNGYLHAAAVIALADTAAGFATLAHLPDGALNFTTLELKSNFLGTATEGTLRAVVRAAHRGRTTQVWDAAVTHVDSGRTLALFRCTQLVIWPRT
jgi:uncharacterized protein (TIGR00369 family)